MVRLSKDIATLLTGTPAATEARLELVTRTKTWSTLLPTVSRSVVVRSRKPKASTPLKTKLALPSHRLSKLKAALIMVGEFLGIARRTFFPLTLKRSACGVEQSTVLLGEVAPTQAGFLLGSTDGQAGGSPSGMPQNRLRRTPWEAKM